MECSPLNVLDVLRSVGFSAAYWRELGQRLKPDLDVDTIAADHPRSVEECLEAAVSSWLRDGNLGGDGGGGGTWEVLAAAVERCRRGGGRNVAAKIRREISSSGGPDSSHSAGASNTTAPEQDSTPTMYQLHCLRVGNQEMKIVQTVASKWDSLAFFLNFSSAYVQIIQRDHSNSAVRGCEKMLGDWLEGREEVRRPLTWRTLTEALKETEEFQTLANDIETSLNNLEQ